MSFVSFDCASMPLAEAPGGVLEQLSYAPGRDFFASLEWFSLLARESFAPPVDPQLLLCGASGKLGPCLVMQPPAGRRLVSLTTPYTTRFSPAAVADAGALAAVARHVYALARPPAVVELRYLREDAPSTQTVARAFRQAGFAVDRFFQSVNHYAPVEPGNFDAYFAARPARLRNTWRRRLARAKATGAVRTTILTGAGPALDQAIDAYLRIYAASWKPAERFPGFMPALIRLCCRLGIGRLGVLSIDGVPAASQFWITDAGTALVYKLAYDPAQARLSVGTLLTAEMFRHAIDEDRVTEIDFGLGDENYKRDWVDERRRIVGLQALHPGTAAGRALMARNVLRGLVRRARAPLRPARNGQAVT